MQAIQTILILFFFTSSLLAQQVTVSGYISDEAGLPLPGVNIIEKGTANGTQTDFNGNYTISVTKGARLVYSYVGFETEERKVRNNDKTINVSLKVGALLEEVIVAGYAKEIERKPLRHTVSPVTVEDLSNKRSNDLVRSLNGKVAGVQITGAGGAVGSGTNFKLRGNSTIPTAPITEYESYDRIEENIFKRVNTAPLSTFSIDVDKAGYSNIRRMINNGQTIPQDAVKVEEMINYFNYDYPEPTNGAPFSITTDMSFSPWNEQAKLVRIGLKGKDITKGNTKLPASNLVFLLDVSGSMNSPNKLPLLKSAMHVLVDQLREEDTVSIVVYAGAAGLVLPPTCGHNKDAILGAINRLSAGGSTAGGAGIKLAYKIAEENFVKNGNNRVILATDGDFNVGASNNRSMQDLIEEKRKTGVFLTCLGFGMGNYRDAKMETLADKGNGNHAYIDTMQEARKVLGTEFFGTIYTIAKDVKIQVEFNPNIVQAYRLIGYENRLLNDEDFKDDTKDAGELGSGHTVTALYEVIPVGVQSKYLKEIDNLKYTQTKLTSNKDEVLTVKFRYKDPKGVVSKLITKTLRNETKELKNMNEDFKFSAAIALFGMQLRNSEFIDTQEKKRVIALAESGVGNDEEGYRAEFIRLVKSSL